MKNDQSKPMWNKNLRHFKQGFSFRLQRERQTELFDLLTAGGLADSSLCRSSFDQILKGMNGEGPLDAFVSFRHAKHAAWFKLSWQLCEINDEKLYPKIIMPIIRRVMPSIIAHDIIGVAPMTGPTSSIFSLRMKYWDSKGDQEEE